MLLLDQYWCITEFPLVLSLPYFLVECVIWMFPVLGPVVWLWMSSPEQGLLGSKILVLFAAAAAVVSFPFSYVGYCVCLILKLM